MSSKPYPSQTQDRYIVRLPDGMRDRIAEAAKANNRSMNAEIVARLESSFEQEAETMALFDQLFRDREEIKRRIAAIEAELPKKAKR